MLCGANQALRSSLTAARVRRVADCRGAAEQRHELASRRVGSPPQTGGRDGNTLLCITAKLIVEWQRWVIFDPRGRSDTSLFVCFAPKATFTNQDVIR
jgi:hypothetical protein